MAGIIKKKVPYMNKFEFKYTRTAGGWIGIQICSGGTVLEYSFTCAFEGPITLLEWAEKILNGENSELAIDEEDDSWFIAYDGKYIIISDDISDDNSTKSIDDKFIRLKVECDRKIFCRKLYISFLDYISSDIYKPRDWEYFPFTEILLGEEKYYESSEEYKKDLEKIAELSSREIKDKLIFSDFPFSINTWINYDKYFKKYDFASLEERKGILDYVEERTHGYTCDILTRYRSKKLEKILDTPYNILSYVKEYDVDAGFTQFTGFCFVIDGKKVLYDGYTLLNYPTIKDWKNERIIINMCTCTCWECDAVIAEVTYGDYITWTIKGYRTNEIYGEYKFKRDNYFKVISDMTLDATLENHKELLGKNRKNNLSKKMKYFFSKNGLNDLYDIDEKLISFVIGNSDIENLIKETIDFGKITNINSLKFNYDDISYRTFILVEKYYGNLGIGLIIEELNNDEYEIKRVFIKSKKFISCLQCCYYPDEDEMKGKLSMAVGASDTDFYDNELVFENDYFQDWYAGDIEFNHFALVVPDSINGYNDTDCIGDDITPLRKTHIKAKKIIKEQNFGIDFYRIKAVIDSLPITETLKEDVECIIYIPVSYIKNKEILLDETELSLLVFGNMNWKYFPIHEMQD
ncbi:MAG: hypothetical protein IK024_06425 [Treponema sp.]|nr:hypothetical protein [Treponema sp.]